MQRNEVTEEGVSSLNNALNNLHHSSREDIDMLDVFIGK
jgi:hypothetical protein